MRFVKSWLSPLVVGLALSVSPAWALPVPKLPPQATDKPSVVVRIRPIAELLKDVQYVAKMVGQEEVFNAFEPGIQPVIDALDGTRPVGFYAKVGPEGIDSTGILMIPVKKEKDFIGLLNQLNVFPNEGQGGLYSVNVPGAPFGVIFRYSNGYIYASMKNTPDAEASLAPTKLYSAETLFKKDDAGVASLTINVDALPNELKKKGLSGLEEVLRQFRANELPKQDNPIIRAALDTIAEELAIKIQSLITDAQTITYKLDLDRAKEDIAVTFRLTARPDSALAKDIEIAGPSPILGAGIVTPDGLGNLALNISVPASMQKAIDPLVDQLVGEAWKKAKDHEQPFVKELLEILGPTLKSGRLDLGLDVRGPDSDNHIALLAAVKVKDADKLEGLLRKIHGVLGAREKEVIKLDVDKVAGVNLHQFPTRFDANAEKVFGEQSRVIAAFRSDAVVIGLGTEASAKAAVKSGVEASPKSSNLAQGQVLIRKFAAMLEPKDRGAVDAAKKAFPTGVSDAYRLSVTGGQNLEVRVSASSRVIQFAYLLEQARRNR